MPRQVKNLFLCLLSAALLIFSFPGFNLEFLAWFAFVPLFFVLQNKSKLKAFLWAYLTGVLFWAGLIYWLVHVTLLGTIVLVLYLALYFGIFGLIFSTRNQFLIPSIWVLLEYTRSHILAGFPWALLGYSQTFNLPVIQIADITGAWGVSFLVMMVNAAVYSFLIHRRKEYLLPLICLIAALSYGYYRYYASPAAGQLQPLKISVVQGNIPQEMKWDPQARDYILERYIRLTKLAAQEKPDMIIWPEAANPEIGNLNTGAFDGILSLAKEIKTPLLYGSVIDENGEQYYNSCLLTDAEGKIVSRYNKLHLVPFGEYIPLRKSLPFLETIAPIGDITPGKEYTLFEIQNKFSVLICFEDLFPELSREFVERGAQFLVNITNDAWYKKTAAAFQHFQASVFRAVENRVFLVRVANTGVSGFISPKGQVLSLVQDASGDRIFVEGVDTQVIGGAIFPRSFYTLHGDIFVHLLFILSGAYGIFLFLKRR